VNGNTTSAWLTVTAHPAVSILKQVGPTATGPWYSFLPASAGANVYYKFTVDNPGDVTLTG